MTHKVLKSCRSTIATWAHDVYDVHEASSLYKKPVGEFFYICICIIYYIYIYIYIYSSDGGSPPTSRSSSRNVIFCCSHGYCTTFVLISYSVGTQVMLSLILIDIQYLQTIVFSFEKGLNRQNHSSPPVKKNSP